MNKRLLLFIFIVGFIVFRYWNQGGETTSEENSEVVALITLAKSYEGVSYRAGGTTKRGMDCSGLVTTVFRAFDKSLPRSSALMSREGVEIPLSKVKKGDLLFFDIARLKGNINHVGLVTSVENGEVKFIHSTTSKGVITTSINEPYWKEAFVKAKRVL
ncbi:C40 family peptidase [uncultured Tenacibaculum sp.]|uniref:C40 family peptidase n=1 Tax=uncultured Tenacibaculum sp. TaxID=174713 RepID=UPI00260C508D|nr:C40 family peptidase [uncultured Tenacibaculum sp.]